MRKPKPHGKGIVKALGQSGTTGNFAKIASSKGKGAAIAALQNKLAKHRGQPIPYHRKGTHKHKVANASTPTDTADRVHHKNKPTKPTKRTSKGLPPGLAKYLSDKRAGKVLQSGPKKPMPTPMMPGAPMMKHKKYDFKKAEKKLGMVS